LHVFAKDFRLAALVATGKLRLEGGAILDALFKSAMLKVTRQCEKRPGSSKYFDSELGAELVFTLGRDGSMKELLRTDDHIIFLIFIFFTDKLYRSN